MLTCKDSERPLYFPDARAVNAIEGSALGGSYIWVCDRRVPFEVAEEPVEVAALWRQAEMDEEAERTAMFRQRYGDG